jgi:hypothetical protein
MRNITTHHDGHGLNESITINADLKGPGGASHRYDAYVTVQRGDASAIHALKVQFQEGPRNVMSSTPGVTEAVLLAILIDRLEGFQAGDYPSPYNERMLDHLRAALQETKARADERAARGVLGTYNK